MMPILITEETEKTRPRLNPRKLRDTRDGNVSTLQTQMSQKFQIMNNRPTKWIAQ